MGLKFDFQPNSTPFKELETRGHAVISNIALRYSILNLHTVEYHSIRTSFQNEAHNLREVYRPEIRKHIKISPSNFRQYFDENSQEVSIYSPIAFNDMIKDRQFINAITIMHNNNLFMIGDLEELKKKIEAVIKQIDDELLK
jgi:hypothetical protein